MAVNKTETGVPDLSRRTFLADTGKVALGLAIGSVGLSLAGCSAKTTGSKTKQELPAWPWTYSKKLDPNAVAKLAYEGFYQGACCYAVANSILTELKNKVGFPFTQIPSDMFRYGEGGIVGWASLCGTLNGASAVINLVSPKEVYGPLINELMGWYTETAFPVYVPEGKDKLVTSKSGSPLCHVSVTNWCKVSKAGAESKERAERCARLCGDVGKRVAEMLNDNADGKFVAAYKDPASITGCMSCHGKTAMNNTRGKMACVQCHTPHKIK